MSSDETQRRVRLFAIVAEILEIDADGIKGTDLLREDLGMDSLGSLELLSVISEELKLDLEMEEAMEIKTVDDAVAFVEKNLAEQHPSQAEARA
jgi:acyl carrier protein